MKDEVANVVLALDGAERTVSARWVTAERLTSWVWTLILGGGAIAGASVFVVRDGSIWSVMVLGLALIAACALGLVSHWYPAAAYKRLRYALNDRGIEIRRGVWWRSVVSVPKQRVQHTDVQQGPFMRRLSVSKLVIHTAGTQHAKVDLPGLEYGQALLVRDHLIGRGVGSGCDDG